MSPTRRPLRAVRVATAASVVLLLASCAAGPTRPTGSSSAGDDPGRFAVDVDVDTPRLRELREQAGLDQCPTPITPPSDAAEPMPSVTLPCLGGGPDVELDRLRGPMVVNLWAQWCPPCRAELPHYQELHERAGDEVAVLGVDYQDTRPDWALELLAETGVTYPSLADPGSELRVPFRVRGLPGIVFLDEDGEVVAVEYVVIESFQQLADLVHEHLGVAVGRAG